MSGFRKKVEITCSSHKRLKLTVKQAIPSTTSFRCCISFSSKKAKMASSTPSTPMTLWPSSYNLRLWKTCFMALQPEYLKTYTISCPKFCHKVERRISSVTHPLTVCGSDPARKCWRNCCARAIPSTPSVLSNIPDGFPFYTISKFICAAQR